MAAPANITATILAGALLWLIVVFMIFAPFLMSGNNTQYILPLAIMMIFFFINMVVSVS